MLVKACIAAGIRMPTHPNWRNVHNKIIKPKRKSRGLLIASSFRPDCIWEFEKNVQFFFNQVYLCVGVIQRQP